MTFISTLYSSDINVGQKYKNKTQVVIRNQNHRLIEPMHYISGGDVILIIVTVCILYMVQRFVLMSLLMLKELIQSVGFVDALRLIREEDGVTIEGDSQLSVAQLVFGLWHEHCGCSDACRKEKGGDVLVKNML